MPVFNRQIAAEGLQFLGMLVSIGGSLTIIVRGFREPIYFIMIVAGLVMWGIGFVLRIMNRPPSS